MQIAQIAIIGGGAAGFIAAVVAAENSPIELNIDIYEKNIPLKKILATGNGRCNLSNKIYDYKELASNYPRGEKFLYSVFSKFGVAETLEWFDKHGVETYTQEDNRIFPDTNKASTVKDMFLDTVKKLAINIYEGIPVHKIEKNGEKFIVNSKKQYDRIIIATGGNSKEFSGGSYELAKNLGHTIKPLKPSLTAFRVQETFIEKLAGVSVKNTEISSYFNNKQVKKFIGDFVFTHKGLSGPVIFKTSAYCCYLDYSKNNPLLLKINFLPDITRKTLEKDLLTELNSNPHKSLENLLKKYLPKSLISVLLENSQLDCEKKANQITKEDRKKILSILTETQFNVISPEPEGEIVTAGGVSLNEINPKTMESKLVKGLYFCGEVLDIDGLTGGFNLQACWSTGFIAGVRVVED